MYDRIYRYLRDLKSETADETNGRHIIPSLVNAHCIDRERPAILDVGAGFGRDLLEVARAIPGADLAAVESYPEAVAFLRQSGVKVSSVDLERDPLPFESGQFDVVICNQVLEHVKEIFWLVSELSRVCKLGGRLVIGVPNLGSLHNKVALLLGQQPPAIHVFGPHVRGFTNRGLVDFLTSAGTLDVVQILGGNFYPFPPSVSRPLARLMPGLAVSSFLLVVKRSSEDFLKVFESERASQLVDTPYFRGN